MLRYIVKVLAYYLILWVIISISSISVVSVFSILLLAAILALVNTLLRPMLVIIALPFNLFTFGIASIFANMLSLIISNAISGRVFQSSFWILFLISAAIMFADDLIRMIRIKQRSIAH